MFPLIRTKNKNTMLDSSSLFWGGGQFFLCYSEDFSLFQNHFSIFCFLCGLLTSCSLSEAVLSEAGSSKLLWEDILDLEKKKFCCFFRVFCQDNDAPAYDVFLFPNTNTTQNKSTRFLCVITSCVPFMYYVVTGVVCCQYADVSELHE